MMDLNKKMDKYWPLFIGCVVLLLFACNITVFYPGYMSGDSLSQLSQALGVNVVGDWNPPIMVFVWRALIKIFGNPSAMLILQLLLLWSTLGILSLFTYSKTRSKKFSVAILLVGLLPFILNISGVIWKDVQMTFSLSLAFVLLLVFKYIKHKVLRVSVVIIIFGLLTYACLLRYNALLAIIPIIYLAVDEIFVRIRKYIYKIVITIVICGVILFVGSIVNVFLSSASDNPLSSVMVDDIINIKSPKELVESKENIVSDLAKIQEVCTQKSVIINSYWFCADDKQRADVHMFYYEDLKKYWLESIISEPLRYIVFRIETFAIFLFPPDSQYGGGYVWHYGIDKNSLGQKISFEKLGHAVEIYTKNFGYKHFSFLFQAWFWLIAGIAAILYGIKLTKSKKYIITLAVSSIIYILCYIPVVVAVDYRYIYWPALSTVMAFILIIIERRAITNNVILSKFKSTKNG